MVDLDGDHESYHQVSLEFHYALDPDLETVEGASKWWFRDPGDDFSVCLEVIEIDQIWQRLAGKAVRDFIISANDV